MGKAMSSHVLSTHNFGSALETLEGDRSALPESAKLESEIKSRDIEINTHTNVTAEDLSASLGHYEQASCLQRELNILTHDTGLDTQETVSREADRVQTIPWHLARSVRRDGSYLQGIRQGQQRLDQREGTSHLPLLTRRRAPQIGGWSSVC